MRRMKVDSSAFLLIAIFLLLLGGGIATYFSLRTDPIKDALSGDRVVNALFVIAQDGKPLNSYVLMMYPATKRAAVFDVPGEIGLIIRSVNRVDRIDTLYHPQRNSEYIREVSSLLGIDIPFFVTIDIKKLGSLVDLFSGIELFIPDPVAIYDPPAPILLPGGVVTLDGEKAQLYATYELFEEDKELIVARRQRLFLALLKRLGEKNDFLKLPAVEKIYLGLMDSSMNPRTRSLLFDEYVAIDTDRLIIQRVGGNLKDVSGKMLLFPFYDGNLIKEIVKQTLSSLTRMSEGPITERVFTVEVLNGTPGAGLARRTAELLQGFGYDVISTGNADRNDYEKTEITDRSGYGDMAQIFADVIKCRVLRSEPQASPSQDIQSVEYKADFTIIIGKDFNGRFVVE
jgi:anionic cell wall polymer biosynthesis LytR-Cps2A-Psr (LCP) family protein